MHDMNFLKNEKWFRKEFHGMIFRRMVLGDGHTITRRRSPCIVLEGSPTHSSRRVVPYFYLHFGSIFSRTTSFVLKMMFSHTWLRQV